jgi:hypothetical protein
MIGDHLIAYNASNEYTDYDIHQTYSRLNQMK